MSEDQEKTPADDEAPKAASAKPKKKKARAEGEGLETIRDRNQRIREEAAEKRRQRRQGERRPATAAGLDASEMMDDALARGTHVAAGWLKRNINVIQWVVVLGVAGGIGWQIYTHQKRKGDGAATDSLMNAVGAENARVGDEDTGEPDPRTLLADTRQHFAKDADRLAAAASAYGAVSGSATTKLLARLGLAGVYFDQKKYKEALGEYRAVRDSSLAAEDADVKGRTIEGIGMSEEALGNTEGALKAFRELGNLENAGFSGLGLYHQARVAFQKGDRQQAQDLLKKAIEKVAKKTDASKGEMPSPPGYVEAAAKSLLAAIDPSSAQAAPGKLTPEQIEKLTQQADGKGDPASQEKLKELLKQLQDKMPAELPSGEPAPAPAPAPASSK
ncbi:MAG TPA: tetratricopeptide repeat protein [Polyangiaceae bacterium]